MNIADDFVVHDSVLPDELFLAIKNTFLGNQFPWYYQDYKVREFDKNESIDNFYDYQFTHMLYNEFNSQSSFITLLYPLIEFLNPSALVRIKANLTLFAEKQVMYEYHTDLTNFYGKTAIFYLNTTNGQTLFENRESIDCIENRLVIFDSKIKHTGSSCTNNKTRCVINLNFYEQEK